MNDQNNYENKNKSLDPLRPLFKEGDSRFIYKASFKSKIKKDPRSIQKARNSIRAFTFNVLDIEDKRIYKDSRNIKLIKNLKKDVAILKPDKGNGVVIIDISDYRTCLAQLFEDITKFRKIDSDPTFTRLKTLQRYLLSLNKRDEIDEAQYKSMRPQHAKPARAHGLPKTHKKFDKLPKIPSNNRHSWLNTLQCWKVVDESTKSTHRQRVCLQRFFRCRD